ncbi:hypothetical protein MYXO_02953 [Myxococcaceae bacterium]|nr:hypothetical protein MYXO_02953 [Myxococcaceae bacterium]
MPRLSPMDEFFVHQIPEPFPNVVTHHAFWRDSLFFVMHPRDAEGDVVILTMASFPARGELDSLQLGRVGGVLQYARHSRPFDGDPHTMAVGPVTIDIVEPYRSVRLRVADVPEAPVSMDVTFTARTAAYALRRGTMKAGHELIWDQSHMVQSGEYRGWFRRAGKTVDVDGWWGQRDHSWGIRDHARCPMWQWFAIQLPDGMIGGWHWEYANGARVFTDGCFAPAGGAEPVPVIDYRHDLHWLDAGGRRTSYGRDGENVDGLEGRLEFTLEGGRRIGVEGRGRWAARYGPYGGGQNLLAVRTDDGREGVAIHEITGGHHHHFFPVPRAEKFPPDGE